MAQDLHVEKAPRDLIFVTRDLHVEKAKGNVYISEQKSVNTDWKL